MLLSNSYGFKKFTYIIDIEINQMKITISIELFQGIKNAEKNYSEIFFQGLNLEKLHFI